MDAPTHNRFLEYRERYGYFARGEPPCLSFERFAELDAEQRALQAAGRDRDDEQKARLAELNGLLFRD